MCGKKPNRQTHEYEGKEIIAYKSRIRAAAIRAAVKEKIKEFPPKVPLQMWLLFVLPRQVTRKDKRQGYKQITRSGQWPCQRGIGDYDNYAKPITDASEHKSVTKRKTGEHFNIRGILGNDSQVCICHVAKAFEDTIGKPVGAYVKLATIPDSYLWQFSEFADFFPKSEI